MGKILQITKLSNKMKSNPNECVCPVVCCILEVTVKLKVFCSIIKVQIYQYYKYEISVVRCRCGLQTSVHNFFFYLKALIKKKKLFIYLFIFLH